MKSRVDLFILLGFLIYLAYSIVDRFIYKFNNLTAMLILGLGLILMIIGIVRSR